ncbi:MAG: hypothetical protein GJ676_09285 [Rhodobacteraceae bacterium]|nr:hypothetical protein [Paracoccaceae bacterium]
MKLMIVAFSLLLISTDAWAQSSMAKGFSSFRKMMVDEKYAVQRVRFQDGAKAERFEVRPGDCVGTDCKQDRERAEYYQWGGEKHGKDAWYAWSIFVPGDFPRMGHKMWVKLGQFHQTGGSGPELLFQLGDRQFTAIMKSPYVRDDDPMRPAKNEAEVRLASKSQMLGRWNRVMVNAKWSQQKDGYLHLYMNGKKIWSYLGPTSNDSEPIYFRYGIYRSFVSRCGGPCPTVVAYFRDVKRGTSRSRVE